jgi:hypothetical protein
MLQVKRLSWLRDARDAGPGPRKGADCAEPPEGFHDQRLTRPDRTADADPLPGWECRPDDPVLIVGRSPQAPPIGAQDEADFVRPFNWLRD